MKRHMPCFVDFWERTLGELPFFLNKNGGGGDEGLRNGGGCMEKGRKGKLGLDCKINK